MPGRIVLYGATGYIGGLTARAMVAVGARPVLAGRDQGRLNALAEQLSRNSDGVKLETAVAGSAGPGPLRELIGAERTAARVASFEIDGSRRQAFSIGSSEHFALPRLRRQPPLTDVGVYLGWFGAATGLVHYASALAAPLERLKSVREVLDQQARRIQHSRATPGAGQTLRSDVVAEAADARGRRLAMVRLTGGDPYSFTAPILAWAASTAAAQGVRPAGALGPAEAFGLASLERACAEAGFHRHHLREPRSHCPSGARTG